jgi:hypothetical protein
VRELWSTESLALIPWKSAQATAVQVREYIAPRTDSGATPRWRPNDVGTSDERAFAYVPPDPPAAPPAPRRVEIGK